MENENREYGFGTENRQIEPENPGYGEMEQTYGDPGQQSEGTPEHTYGVPEQPSEGTPEQTYGDPSQQVYGQPGCGDMNQQSYGGGSCGDQNQQSYGGTSYGDMNQQSYGGGSCGDPNQQSYGGTSYGDPNQQAYGSSSYGNPNQQAYGQPNYGSAYGQAGQPYGGAAYGQPNYSTGPVDRNGRPLKNRFGMKMTFSILEILSCCGCNLLTMIMGILGCVFSVQADSAYKEGRWEDFKSKAKTSSIFLWVGLGISVFFVIYVIFVWTAGGGAAAFKEAFWEGYYSVGGTTDNYDGDYYSDDNAGFDYDYNYEDDYIVDPEDEAKEEQSAPLVIDEGVGFYDPTITIDGITVSLPITYTELKAMGLSVDAEDEAYVINKGEYDSPTLYGPDGKELGYVHVGNPTDQPMTSEECLVFGFWFSSIDFEDGVSVFFANGLTQDATYEDFVKAYGEPDYSYEGEDSDYASYQWYSHSDEYYDMEENSISVDFWEGELDELDIMYIGWE